ncbi:hypothetical protein IAU59_005261 [Kwoniella sp. CBS 9459]
MHPDSHTLSEWIPRQAWWTRPVQDASCAAVDGRWGLHPSSSVVSSCSDGTARNGSAVSSLLSTPRESTLSPDFLPEQGGTSNRSSVFIDLPPYLIGRSPSSVSQIFVDASNHDDMGENAFPDLRMMKLSEIPPMPTFGSDVASLSSMRAFTDSDSHPPEVRPDRGAQRPPLIQPPHRDTLMSHSAPIVDMTDLPWVEDYLSYMTRYSQQGDTWPTPLRSHNRGQSSCDDVGFANSMMPDLWPEVNLADRTPAETEPGILTHSTLSPVPSYHDILKSISGDTASRESTNQRLDETEHSQGTIAQISRLGSAASTALSSVLSGAHSFFSNMVSGLSSHIPARLTPSHWAIRTPINDSAASGEEQATHGGLKSALDRLAHTVFSADGGTEQGIEDGALGVGQRRDQNSNALHVATLPLFLS